MLFAFRLRKRETVFAGKFAGDETQYHRRGIVIKNICDDWMAHRLCACARAVDFRNDQDAEPVYFESNFDRAICGARSTDGTDGRGCGDACGILTAPRSHCCRAPRDSRSHLRGTGWRVLRVPERRGTFARWRCGHHRAREATP